MALFCSALLLISMHAYSSSLVATGWTETAFQATKTLAMSEHYGLQKAGTFYIQYPLKRFLPSYIVIENICWKNKGPISITFSNMDKATIIYWTMGGKISKFLLTLIQIAKP